MIEIYKNLFIGDEDTYERNVKCQQGWSIVHACKEPYHRRELKYTTRGAPKNHPEYLFARRDNRLILNMIDVQDPEYIKKIMVDAAIQFIFEQLEENKKVLLHCNQGMSRSPGIGLLYLAKHTDTIPKTSFVEAERAFRNLYPLYQPARGMWGFMQKYWKDYSG